MRVNIEGYVAEVAPAERCPCGKRSGSNLLDTGDRTGQVIRDALRPYSRKRHVTYRNAIDVLRFIDRCVAVKNWRANWKREHPHERDPWALEYSRIVPRYALKAGLLDRKRYGRAPLPTEQELLEAQDEFLRAQPKRVRAADQDQLEDAPAVIINEPRRIEGDEVFETLTGRAIFLGGSDRVLHFVASGEDVDCGAEAAIIISAITQSQDPEVRDWRESVDSVRVYPPDHAATNGA